ncbi:hypothetical protein [Erythrobacter litoralis]|uniref:Uncharacterized protein n=1 Tax=Erythrobacter litoralis (strain HTCC2594) TaxID=314225 RepID=Q2N6A5_ERYLH|nr:hypothetical protein [Erythrobacter litoralis]ABC64786.1 hypothetical protein ELI_13470 [Erythrobacter litoralis HTCC2594]
MYEHSRHHFTSPEGHAAGPGPLDEIAWPELVARLAAQRDLRRLLLSDRSGGPASFNGGAAAWLASAGGSNATGKRDVNRDALSDSNQAGAIDADAACGAAGGDREIP